LEGLCDLPEGGVFQGTVVIAHPHPLFGGTMQNKVVQTLAKAFVQNGWRAIRFNFRGVGASEGAYDDGRGEVDDLMSVIEATCATTQPMALAGFSFGAFVTSHAVARLSPANKLEKLVFVGTAASRFQVAPVPTELHDKTLVLHGEVDDTVPLASVMDWLDRSPCRSRSYPGLNISFTDSCPCFVT